MPLQGSRVSQLPSWNSLVAASLKQMLACLLIGVLSILMPVQADGEALQWQHAKDKNGVAVSTAEVAGSSFLAFKAVTVIHAQMQDILTVLADHAAYPQWYNKVKQAQMIEPYVNDQAVVHIRIQMPFPLADRDTVNQVTVRFEDGNAEVILTSVAGRVPPVKGLVRMTQASGSWLLEPIEDGTRVTHVYHADPEIRVPRWVMNSYLIDGPIKSLVKLRRRIERIQG